MTFSNILDRIHRSDIGLQFFTSNKFLFLNLAGFYEFSNLEGVWMSVELIEIDELLDGQ